MSEIEHVARGDRAGYGILGPEQAVDDPGLATHLGEDPAELAGDIGKDDGEGHDPQEPAIRRKPVRQANMTARRARRTKRKPRATMILKLQKRDGDGRPLIGREVEESLHRCRRVW